MVLDSQLRDPNVTHATLVTSGTPLPSVESTRDVVLSEGGPFLYMRKSDNPRMNKFLGTLVFALSPDTHEPSFLPSTNVQVGPDLRLPTKTAPWEDPVLSHKLQDLGSRQPPRVLQPQV